MEAAREATGAWTRIRETDGGCPKTSDGAAGEGSHNGRWTPGTEAEPWPGLGIHISFGTVPRRGSRPTGLGSVRLQGVRPAAVRASVMTLDDKQLVLAPTHHAESLPPYVVRGTRLARVSDATEDSPAYHP